MATITYKEEFFKTASGQEMYIEQYSDKPFKRRFWRYGFTFTNHGSTWKSLPISDMLFSKPNKKRLIETY
jgi:hypothetical protein